MKLEEAEKIRSFCCICPWQCSTEVFVKNGKVVYIRGNPEAPNNKGTRCAKGMASIHLPNDPDRLKYPLKRVGERGKGEFKRISWDEAFNTIAEKLKEIKERYGPEAVIYLWHQDYNSVFAQIFFTELYGSPNFCGHTAACEQDRRLAALTLFGHIFPTRDYINSRYIMIWGYNPLEAHQTLTETNSLIKALERGAKLVVVDPFFSGTAEKADEWIQLNPASDGALALAMCYVIVNENLYDGEFVNNWCHGFDEFKEHLNQKGYSPEWAEKITGVPEETIVRIAREFATTKPAVAECFKGLCNYANGHDAARAVYILNAITGNVDEPGNLILKDFAPLRPPVPIPDDKKAEIEADPLHVAMGYPLAPDLPSGLLPEAVLNETPYPVKGLITQAINPIMSEMNTSQWIEMYKNIEFPVAIEHYMTETAIMADIVLPEASFYERAEIRQGLWSGPLALLCQPAVPPVGESKPLYDIIKGIAKKMGYGEYFNYSSWEDWAEEVIKDLPIGMDELKERGFWAGDVVYHKYKNGLPTPSGKVEIYSENFAKNGYNPLPEYKEPKIYPDEEYPLQLINAKVATQCNVVTQNFPLLMEIMDENCAVINSKDAIRHGINDGDYVELESPLDKAKIKAKVSEDVNPGVVCVRHGHGFGHWASGSVAKRKGTHINSLIDINVNPISGGNGYNECRVKIRRVE